MPAATGKLSTSMLGRPETGAKRRGNRPSNQKVKSMGMTKVQRKKLSERLDEARLLAEEAGYVFHKLAVTIGYTLAERKHHGISLDRVVEICKARIAEKETSRLTRAAEEMHLAQPTVSLQRAKLIVSSASAFRALGGSSSVAASSPEPTHSKA